MWIYNCSHQCVSIFDDIRTFLHHSTNRSKNIAHNFKIVSWCFCPQFISICGLLMIKGSKLWNMKPCMSPIQPKFNWLKLYDIIVCITTLLPEIFQCHMYFIIFSPWPGFISITYFFQFTKKFAYQGFDQKIREID